MLYTSYSTNLSKRQLHQICGGPVEFYGKGIIENHALSFHFFATLAKKAGSNTPVVVYNISLEQETTLDRYEGLHDGIFRKTKLQVKLDTGEVVEAMTYLLNKVKGPFYAPSKGYIQTIREGYNDYSLDTTFLNAALRKIKSISDYKVGLVGKR